MMNRQQIRDVLGQIAREAFASKEHAAESKQSAQRAYDMARRLERSLALPVDEPLPEPEPVELPVVEPGKPSGRVPHWLATRHGHYTLLLAPDSRISRRPTNLTIARPEHDGRMPFVEQFITEAGGVVETICVLHNGNPEGRGAIIIPRLEVKTHDGRSIFPWKGPVTIEPGGMLVVRDYEAKGRSVQVVLESLGLPLDSQSDLQRVFFSKLSGPYDEAKATPQDIAEELVRWHDREFHNPVTVGPYDVMWGSRGDEVGGAGTEPDWFEWRRCPAGYALAALEMYRTANRTSRCMTDDKGAFTWDNGTAYTSVGDFMPDAFKWEPRDATEQAMADYKNHDGQHFFRAYRAAMALARETKHPFAMWYLSCLANFQQAAHLGTKGDGATQHWWSLKKKLANVEGPNIWCGRQGVHEARFATEYARLFPKDSDARTLAAQYRKLFSKSIDENGVPFVMPTSAIVSEDAPQAWGADPAFQTFEIQLAILMFEDSGDPVLERAAKKLADYIGPFPPYVKNVKTGAGSGKANPYMNLATHGVGFATGADMWKVTKERLASGGPESGGAVPANSFRPRRGIAQ